MIVSFPMYEPPGMRDAVEAWWAAVGYGRSAAPGEDLDGDLLIGVASRGACLSTLELVLESAGAQRGALLVKNPGRRVLVDRETDERAALDRQRGFEHSERADGDAARVADLGQDLPHQ